MIRNFKYKALNSNNINMDVKMAQVANKVLNSFINSISVFRIFKYLVGGKMKSKYTLLFTVYCLLFTLFLWSCGGGDGPGSPGSEGSEKTGVILDAYVTPVYLGENTPDVDAFQDICDPGPPPEYEEFTDHYATVTINARLLNPNTTFRPGNLYVEKYTIEYRRSTDSIGSPPIETYVAYSTIPIFPPTGTGVTTVEAPVMFVDLIRKEKYRTDVTSGQYTSGPSYINNYTAIYTFEGKNDFGDKFKFKTQVDFSIGWYLNCD